MTVLNKYKDYIPPDAIYIGRGSVWGNPYALSESMTREESVAKFKVYIKNQIKSGNITLQQLASLHNKDIVCYCTPKTCHGHVLEKLATWAFNRLYI